MTDQQCGLCLSCGAPFLPDIEEVDFFNREANLSILFLNTQFKRNPDIQRTYDLPKLCSDRQASHMFHQSYHQTALEYMCERHTDDNNVGMGMGMAPNNVVPNQNNVPFLYYHTITGHKGPMAATWNKPVQNNRLDMKLFEYMDRCAQAGNYVVPAPQRDITYDMCRGCNSLMTQKSHMRFLLGVRNAGKKNGRGRIIPVRAYNEYSMEAHRQLLDGAYGAWTVQNGVARRAPRLIKSDSDAPAIAYYLHMCLPYQTDGNNVFHNFRPQSLRRARALYLELCWVVLEIACLAVLVEEGTATKPRGHKKSHGQHQHLGVLDVYVSFFLWRLMHFTFGNRAVVRQLDFVQFHQKYFADIRNCPGLLTDAQRGVTTGKLAYSISNQSGLSLVEEICTNLVDLFEGPLHPFFHFCVGIELRVPNTVKEYFLPVAVIATLRTRSTQVHLFHVRARDFRG